MEPVVPRQRDLSRASVSVAQGAITLVVVVLASLALDDITTDNSAAFLPEYGMLAAAGAWGLFVAYTLLRTGHRFVGTMSMVAVGAAAWVAFDGLGHKRDGGWSAFWPEYSVMLTTWVWFIALSVPCLRSADGR
jgi:hypothetical protein